MMNLDRKGLLDANIGTPSASVRILLRKIDKLAADFADLAALDVRLPARDKSSVALLLACRPWVFSMFSAYRAKAAA